MNSTRAQRSRRFRLGVALVALVAAVTVALGVGGLARASDRGPEMGVPAATVGPQTQEAEGKDSEANLPYLFAVFIITWAAFFGYVFIMSRRQREIRAEIEALKRALAEREHRAVGPQPEQESAGGEAGPTSR
jgi:CcmD family protein